MVRTHPFRALFLLVLAGLTAVARSEAQTATKETAPVVALAAQYSAFKDQLTIARIEELTRRKTAKRLHRDATAPFVLLQVKAFGPYAACADTNRAAALVEVISQIVDVDLLVTEHDPLAYKPCPFSVGWENWGAVGIQGGMFGQDGMFGQGGMFGMFGTGPPPAPSSNGGSVRKEQVHSIEYFPPGLTLIVRGPSRIHTSITGSIIGGQQQRTPNAVARKKASAPDWKAVFSQGGIDSGMVIAAADFLFEAGKFDHAAEFLKANLRAGIVVRPWVYEALAVARETVGADSHEVLALRYVALVLRRYSPGIREPRPELSTLLKLQGFQVPVRGHR
jgi:hypothetical protein